MTVAQHFHSLSDGRIQCRLCRQSCILAPNERGLCGVREASNDGTLHTLVAEGVAAWHVDPVEKKPLYHYLPGSKTFSFGTAGCNMDCAWCQNDTISRSPAESGCIPSTPATSTEMVQAALQSQCQSVAFTYTEPTVFFELMVKTADEALAAGLGTIMVSNGYQSPACLDDLRHRIHAANIDLKSFRSHVYRQWCRAGLDGVLDSLRIMKSMGWWLEITTLIIPGINDDPMEWREMATFIRQELGPETPWHLSAFHPCRHMLDSPPTPVSTLLHAAAIARAEGLHFVYLGNISDDTATQCPHCRHILVHRHGFQATMPNDFHEQCPVCHFTIPGIWQQLP